MTVFRRISGSKGTVDGLSDPSKWLERSKESVDWDEWRLRSRRLAVRGWLLAVGFCKPGLLGY